MDNSTSVQEYPIALGWARTAVNAVIFRRNSIVSDVNQQFVAFYDADAHVVLARRDLGSGDWTVKRTPYQGRVQDAHNSISIMLDGAGYLHMAWDHHNHALRYCRSVAPGSLELTEMLPMTGQQETRVTYPEFHRMPDGDLVFLYRDGASGNGNLLLNYYDAQQQTWTQRQTNLIDGEGQRNAYWQMCSDRQGTLHLAWVWRETPDVATNHDIGYARSRDRGYTWERSDGSAYSLPINLANAEYACRIPQNSELFNQTSISADGHGHPYIAMPWRPAETDVPQYHLVYHDGVQWQTRQVLHRKTLFTMAGRGTRRVPISRPQIVIDDQNVACMVFRDVEREEHVSVAVCRDLLAGEWTVQDLTDYSVGAWEPSYDTERWQRDNQLHLFVQTVGQGDGETETDLPPQMVKVLEWQVG